MTNRNDVTPKPSHPISAPTKLPIKIRITIDETNLITIKINRV